MWTRVFVLVVLWAMTLVTILVLQAMGAIDVKGTISLFGQDFTAAGVAALFVLVILVLLFVLDKIPGIPTRLAAAFRMMVGGS